MKTLTKIRISTQEVIESKSHPTHILTPCVGEELVEIDSEHRPICGQIKDGNTVRDRRPDEFPILQKDPEEVKKDQDFLSAIAKVAATAKLSLDEKAAFEEKLKYLKSKRRN